MFLVKEKKEKKIKNLKNNILFLYLVCLGIFLFLKLFIYLTIIYLLLLFNLLWYK